jgi:hypothetical protein
MADMAMGRQKLLERAENARRESKFLDFKLEFKTDSAADWCEVVKDIAAFANSGGGVIIFGVNNDGSSAGTDISRILALDIADITNKMNSYAGFQFVDLEILEIKRDGVKCAALIISGVDLPMIFIRPGTYDIGGGKQKTAFANGTIYFRHGAKSEPGTRDDLAAWRDEAVEKLRSGWLGGIRKVVQAPTGHAITVVSSPVPTQSGAPQIEGMAIIAKVSSGPGAVRIVPQNAEEIWPYRQKDLLQHINRDLRGARLVNGHDVLCINTYLNVLKAHPKFAYKPHRLASPQYSPAYADWIIEQYRQDPKFFTRMRADYKKRSPNT